PQQGEPGPDPRGAGERAAGLLTSAGPSQARVTLTKLIPKGLPTDAARQAPTSPSTRPTGDLRRPLANAPKGDPVGDTVNGTTKYVASTTLKAPEVAELGTPVGRRRGRMYNPLYLDVLRSIRAALEAAVSQYTTAPSPTVPA